MQTIPDDPRSGVLTDGHAPAKSRQMLYLRLEFGRGKSVYGVTGEGDSHAPHPHRPPH